MEEEEKGEELETITDYDYLVNMAPDTEIFEFFRYYLLGDELWGDGEWGDGEWGDGEWGDEDDENMSEVLIMEEVIKLIMMNRGADDIGFIQENNKRAAELIQNSRRIDDEDKKQLICAISSYINDMMVEMCGIFNGSNPNISETTEKILKIRNSNVDDNRKKLLILSKLNLDASLAYSSTHQPKETRIESVNSAMNALDDLEKNGCSKDKVDFMKSILEDQKKELSNSRGK